MVASSFLSSWRISILCITICASILTPVFAQGTAADYERTEKYAQRINSACTQPTITPRWLPSNTSFWYRTAKGKSASEFVLVDVTTGVRKPAFDHARLAKALNTKNIKADSESLPFSWISPARNGSVVRFRVGDKKWEFGLNGTLVPYSGDLNEENLRPIPNTSATQFTGESTAITFINRGNSILSLFWIESSNATPKPYGEVKVGQSLTMQTFAGHVWRLTNVAGTIIATFRATSDETLAVIEDPSATSRERIENSGHAEDFDDIDEKVMMASLTAPVLKIRLADQFILNNSTVQRNTLEDINDYRSAAKTGEIKRRFPSPVGGYSVVFDRTPAQKHPVYMVESSPKNQTQPLLRTNKEFTYEEYLKPGDKVAIDRPRLLQGRVEIETDDSLFKNPYEITHLGWNADGSEYRFLYNQRGHQILRILGMNLEGNVRIIHEDRQKTFIDYSSKTYFYELNKKPLGKEEDIKRRQEVGGREELIWASERDGWNHLYLIDMKAGSIKQITKGEWVVRSVEYVDEKKRQIWFKGLGMVLGQDHYHIHLARINFDGSNLKVLTEGDGTHSWKWSPDRKSFVDTWSRVDSAPKHILRDTETGKQINELEQGNLECLQAVGWTVPERFVAPGRDGKTDIYGIIFKPSNFDPSKKYPVIEQIYAGPQDFFVPKAFGTQIRQHEYAELGFIVVQIDGMGTNWRHKAFHDTCYKNLKDAGFEDRIAWMKKAQETRPWMDISRVGIYGGSAGGQNAMAALLFHGDFYKAGAADSGCHDNRMDKIWWNEQWMGELDESYIASSNVENAGKLTGALMLLVPELDTNVDPASTMQVINKLTDAHKDYELVFVPGQNHGAGSQPYGLRRQRDFFVRELLGVQPPKRNAKKA
jgi:dipeptidyl-peptidase-4